jgi:catechol 2,3-dioxygenase-like lactoylglutathione lyase family enzyme
MKIRTVYFKVNDMAKAVRFWTEFLQMAPVKTFDKYHEWRIGELNFGLALNVMGDKWSGSNCVPVFEFEDAEVVFWIEKARSLGATVIFDGLEDPELLSFVMADPWGNEFELSKFH